MFCVVVIKWSPLPRPQKVVEVLNQSFTTNESKSVDGRTSSGGRHFIPPSLVVNNIVIGIQITNNHGLNLESLKLNDSIES